MKYVVLSLLLMPLSVAHSADHLAELKARIKILEQKIEKLEQPISPEVTTEDMCIVGFSECGITVHGDLETYTFQYSVKSTKAYIYGPNKEIVRAKSVEVKSETNPNWKLDAAESVCKKHVARIRATIPDCE